MRKPYMVRNVAHSHPIGDVQPSGVTELQGVCVRVCVLFLFGQV